MTVAPALASVRAPGSAMTAGAGATTRTSGASWGSATALSSTLMSEAASNSDRTLGPGNHSHRCPVLPTRQLPEGRRDPLGQRRISVFDLVHQAVDDRLQRPTQLARLQRPHEGGFESMLLLGGQTVQASAFAPRESEAHTCCR